MAVQPPLGQVLWLMGQTGAAGGTPAGAVLRPRSGHTYVPRSWTTNVLVRSVKVNLSGIGSPAAQSGKPSRLKLRDLRPPFSTNGTAAKPPASWKY